MPDALLKPEDAVVQFFRTQLLEWSARNPRPLPWKSIADPYLIWLSEIILQQTRVEQGLPYYEKFARLFPSVQALATASEDELMKAWEGLGYYSRGRNLHASARKIAFEMDGKFPDTYEGIRSLKGIGPYTAAAIASFAFQLPYAVLDGNVYRVLARVMGVSDPINRPPAQKKFDRLANYFLHPEKPALYNQAIMDFGAICCTPGHPLCSACPLASICKAKLENRVAELPVKSVAPVKKQRVFHFVVVRHQGDFFIRKRELKDIWKGLWEFPQTNEPVVINPFGTGAVQTAGPYRQLLTHQKVSAFFYILNLPDHIDRKMLIQHPILENCQPFSIQTFKKKFAFPKVIACFFQDNVLSLK